MTPCEKNVNMVLLFTPVSITSLMDTEDACFGLNASRPIAKGDLKWRDALLVAHRVNSNNMVVSKDFLVRRRISRYTIVTFFILKEREKS